MTRDRPSPDSTPRPRGHGEPAARVIWVLATAGPVVVAGASWLWEAATVTSTECSTGSSGNAIGAIGFLVILLAVPLTIGWCGRHAKPLLATILIPMIVSGVLALPAIILGSQLWWYAHDCYT